MRIAITGHTRGIGKAIADALEARHHEIVGFSRTNHRYLPGDLEHIAREANDCDVFINNVHDGQLEMLYEMWNQWRGSNRRIICIGSRRADTREPNIVSPYAIDKIALDAACEQLNTQRDQRPLVTIINPGYVDTDMVKHVTHSPKLRAQYVADAVVWVLEQPPLVHVSKICLQAQRLG